LSRGGRSRAVKAVARAIIAMRPKPCQPHRIGDDLAPRQPYLLCVHWQLMLIARVPAARRSLMRSGPIVSFLQAFPPMHVAPGSGDPAPWPDLET